MMMIFFFLDSMDIRLLTIDLSILGHKQRIGGVAWYILTKKVGGKYEDEGSMVLQARV